MPSTSGRNFIPEELAKQLQANFGGQILRGVAKSTATFEAKSTKGMRKLENPAGYKLTKDLSSLQGKNVVVVDDFHSTGETGRAMRDALAANGVTSVKEAYLAGKQMLPASYAKIDAVAADLNALTGSKLSEVRPKLVLYFRSRGAELLNQVHDDLQAERRIRGKKVVQDLKTRKENANALLNFLGR